MKINKNIKQEDFEKDFEKDEFTEEDRKRLHSMMNYEHLTELPEMEKELRIVEKKRQKINFEKRFARARKKIEKIDEKLKRKNWSEKDVLEHIEMMIDICTVWDTKTPFAALGVAIREHRILTRYINKLQETIEKYQDELRVKYGIIKPEDNAKEEQSVN